MRRSLEHGGQVGQDLLAVDWSATPLGDPDDWPQSLRSAVRILLHSRFAMWMAWGPELTFFCNDAYRQDTLGSKYPWALGRPAYEVWSEIWDDIEPRVRRVLDHGEATWDESLQLLLERSGYVEETYHTFSYSPLFDDDGVVTGMLCVVSEVTDKVIEMRRIHTLQELGAARGESTEAEVLATACEALSGNRWALPFTAIYLFEDAEGTARLAGTAGFSQPHPAFPELIEAGADGLCPVERLAGRETLTADLSDIAGLPTGQWSEPPLTAALVPLTQPAQPLPYGFLVAGLNRYRRLDDHFWGFVHLVAGQLTAAITDARAFEFERQRAESLAQLDRAKTDFFTNVSHEFRTPLTLLLGPVEDALADQAAPLPGKQRERLVVVQRNAKRLLKLVNSLLDFSQLESGRVISQFEPVDLSRYTADLAAMFDSAAKRAGLGLRVSTGEGVTAYVDQDHWAKIVLNLVSNAVKYTLRGHVEVGLTQEDGLAVLRVRDTGIGVPDDQIPRLFERFHRVPDAVSRSHEGSGIGLALVSELVALHGGTVEAESVHGEGTTMTVRVPLGHAHLPAEQVSPVHDADHDLARDAHELVEETERWQDEDHAHEAAPASSSVGIRPSILVVDDNADMRDYIAGLLTEAYDVRTAVDGIHALELVRAAVPDMVLTDVMMPRLDGFGLLERLHGDPATMHVPVVMLSARAGEEGTVEGLEAGADDYLVKPFSARELLARVRVNLELDRNRRVREALERSSQLLDQAQRLARVGSWEVDLDDRTVRASEGFLGLVGRSAIEIANLSLDELVGLIVRPEDREHVLDLVRAASNGEVIGYEARVVLPDGTERLVAVRAERVLGQDGQGRLRGSMQDITEQREAERALAEIAAREEAAAREHAIADELQRSLLPRRTFDLEHLDVATYYRPGVEGTQVGGDWYDVIDLGAGRTAMVIGDVMGRGVTAASLMGQLRAAVRALAKLELPPGEVLEHLDGIVQDLEGDNIVTCVYAVFDSTDQVLRYANAGHVPPVLVKAGEEPQLLEAGGPPLGAGYFGPTSRVQLHRETILALYTDGLVERRDRDLGDCIDHLGDLLVQHATTPVADLPAVLVQELVPEGTDDDDVALLLARVDSDPYEAAISRHLTAEPVVAAGRRVVQEQLRAWGMDAEVVDEMMLMASELVTNALVHGRPPIDLRLRRSRNELVLEVQDRGAFRPRRRRAEDDDESGRGLQIISVLADSWGSRATGAGKSVWAARTFR